MSLDMRSHSPLVARNLLALTVSWCLLVKVTAGIPVVMCLIDVHMHPGVGSKIPFPRLIRYPGSIKVEIPEARQPLEHRQTIVTDWHVDEMQRAKLRQGGDRLADLLA